MLTNNKATNAYLRSLKKFAGKKVTVLHSGGINSTCMILGLMKVGAARVNVVHINVGTNVHDNCDMDNIAVNNITSYIGITPRVGKLSGVDRDMRADATYKHLVIAQIAPMFIEANDDYVLCGMASGNAGATAIKSIQRAFKSAACMETYQLVKMPKFEFPLLSLHSETTREAFQTLSTEFGFEDLHSLVSVCSNRYGELLINGIHIGCGNCRECRDLGAAFEDFGPRRSILLSTPVNKIHTLFRGGQRMMNVISAGKLETIVINSNGGYSHNVVNIPLTKAEKVDTDSDMYVGTFSEDTLLLPEDYTKAKYAGRAIVKVALDFAAKVRDTISDLVLPSNTVKEEPKTEPKAEPVVDTACTAQGEVLETVAMVDKTKPVISEPEKVKEAIVPKVVYIKVGSKAEMPLDAFVA